MVMIKQAFNIAKRGGSFEVVHGYTCEIGDVKLGFDRRKSSNSSEHHWHTTELTTGLAVVACPSKTRAEAVKNVSAITGKIKDCIKDETYFRTCSHCKKPFNPICNLDWHCSNECYDKSHEKHLEIT